MTKSTQKAKNEGMKDVSFEGGEKEREKEKGLRNMLLP